MIEEVKIPDISENVESGTVVSVLVKTGDTVAVDDPIIELETDKALVEIPTPYEGKVTEILVKEGDEVRIGDVIARVDTEASAVAIKSEQPVEVETAAEIEIEEKQPAAEPVAAPAEDTVPASGKEATLEPPPEKQAVEPPAVRTGPAPASPSVRRLARELGIDIYAVEAGRPGDRITDADVKAHVRKTKPALDRVARPMATGEPRLPDFSRWGEIEAVDLPTVRRITAQSVAASWQTVPHVTQFDQTDITVLNEFIRKNSDRVAKAGGKLTVTAVLLKVCAQALRKFPHFNASIDTVNGKLIFKHYVHIGVMVDTPRGLLVPVVRDVASKNITELAFEIVDLAGRARSKKVTPDELEGGTFSISNQGGIGGTAFTPIVLWPQAAILGVSRTAVKPRYIEGEFRPRSILPLSLSYDHRIIDGADAARFLRWICESLEHPFTMHLD